MSYVKWLPVLAALVIATPAFGHAKKAVPPTTSTMTAPATAPATPAAATPPKTVSPASSSPVATSSTTTKTSSKLPASSQFSTVAAAQSSCPGDTVVWSTMSSSKNYHLAASKYYGKTKHGAYACQKTLDGAGFHASKT